ncbi:MAG TPA: tripartite tricarboxylate transporter substrate-binding protein [Candidatus Binatia bacterium]|jgi:tripartite-type tricarboxylate transporter receptor subunit TctC
MKMVLANIGLCGLVVALFPLAAWAAASSPLSFDERAVADFYQRRSVRIIVGHGAGGGFDTYSRVIARHLGKHIPGKPSIIVMNMPGAGGLVAASHIYKQAPKDGTVIGNVIGGIARSQLLGLQGVQFDAGKFNYLGAPNGENSVLMVTRASGITRFDQLLESAGRVVALGDAGIATTNHTAALLTRDVLGANIKVLTGYGTTAAVELAMEQREVDGQFNDWASNKARTPAKFESEEWLLIGQLTDKPIKGLPRQNVPLILNYAKTNDQRELLRFGIIVPNQFTRPYFLAPGVPADRVAAIRTAFANTLADTEFLAEADRVRLDISPVGASELQKLVTNYLAMPAHIKDKLGKVLPQS